MVEGVELCLLFIAPTCRRCWVLCFGEDDRRVTLMHVCIMSFVSAVA